MKWQLLRYVLCLLIFASFAGAQTGGKNTGTSGTTSSRGSTVPNPELNRQGVLLSGKVVVDDGTQLTEGAAIQTICKGERRMETVSDTHGNFSFSLGGRASSSTNGSFADAADSGKNDSTIVMNSRVVIAQDWRECELRAVLGGFTSDVVELRTRMSSFQSGDIGQVVLHRISQVEGFTVSVTSVAAPSSAKKAYEKGVEQERKDKWDAAEQAYQKAVQIYPKYAVAWCALGQIQLQKKDMVSAKRSFDQSLAADPQYASPYDGLAQLAAQAQQWHELADVTSKLLAMNPVSFTDAWFLNGLGNYNLQNFSAAEKSAREGLRLDQGHHVPKLEYLLGMCLLHLHDFPGAAEHIQKYLGLTTNPAEIQEAQQELDHIARLSSTASASPASPQK